MHRRPPLASRAAPPAGSDSTLAPSAESPPTGWPGQSGETPSERGPSRRSGYCRGVGRVVSGRIFLPRVSGGGEFAPTFEQRPHVGDVEFGLLRRGEIPRDEGQVVIH